MLIKLVLTADRSQDAEAVEFGRPLAHFIWENAFGTTLDELDKRVQKYFDDRNKAGENPLNFTLSKDGLRKLRRVAMLSASEQTFSHVLGVRIPRGVSDDLFDA